jgi:hypothetical protein
MSCEFAHDDGAYVLGALSPADRSAFQAHLSGCAECTRAVQELAGLPGLLARVPADVLEQRDAEPLPDTLLPGLVREVQRVQRRRMWTVVGTAAAAAVVVAGGSLAIGLNVGDDGPGTATAQPSSEAPTGQAMQVVGPEVMTADLALTSVSWGTRLDLTCSYPTPDEPWETAKEWTYAMFVVTKDGNVEQVATWKALPGKTMRLAAATAASRDDIASVEIRTGTGEPLLTLTA